MSTTRLLVLGAVRILQPVHGYFVRRELLSWQADQWAHLNPGSVYNALRSLTRDGYLEETGTEAHGGRPARTSYRLTADGETEFMTLAHDALWNVDPFASDGLLAAWSFSWAFSRAEVVAALEHHAEQIAGSRQRTQWAIRDIERGGAIPAHVAEHWRITQARLDGEAAWASDAANRIQAGEYWFEGEPNSSFQENEPRDGEPA
jgi:DNA-binding PadR family transcriptional regulator